MSESTTQPREAVLDTIRAIWNREAASYDRQPTHRLSEPERWQWRRTLVRTLAPIAGRTPLRVLDVGTGSGEMAVLLANMGCRVTAVDLAPAMLQTARAKAETMGVPLTLIESAADRLPMASESFDVVFSRHLFWTLPEPLIAVKEWARVVRPGGVVAIADGWWYEPGAANTARRAIVNGIRRVLGERQHELPGYATLAGALPALGGVSPYSIRYFLDAADLERIRVRDLRTIRRAELRVQPLWRRIDYPRYTWLAAGYRRS